MKKKNDNDNEEKDEYIVPVEHGYYMCISNNYLYCYVTPISGLLYSISWLLHKNQFLWSSTIAHGMIHVVGNLGNVLLYKGLS